MEQNSLKKVTYALVAVAVILAGVLAYIWIQKSSLVSELQEEKQELTEQMLTLQSDYATLSSDYDTINSQLDSSREEVNQLIERIKQTDATNRRKMRQYEKELGTLRSIMKNYIVQIDSLNTLNKKLTADAAAARRDAARGVRRSFQRRLRAFHHRLLQAPSSRLADFRLPATMLPERLRTAAAGWRSSRLA